MPAGSREQDALALIDRLNRSPAIHGIILQLPLPQHFNARHLSQAIAVEKDVDSFNWRNLGALVEDVPQIAPCTPLAVMTMLDHAGVKFEGRHAVIAGRSTIVGKPVALMLIARSATLTV